MENVNEFLKVSDGDGSGDGSGYGYGSGYGSGSGYGYGSGDGYGDGDGSGDGYGYGYGSGDGDGSGDGSGSGDGDGSGSGYGDGDGDGIRKYTNHHVHYIDGVPTIIYSVKGQVAKGAIIKGDLTLKDCYIAKVGNFFAHGSSIEGSVSDAQAKYNENRPLKDRISDFVSNFNGTDRYPASEFYKWHTTLTGSCSLGKDNFIKEHNIDLNDKMTVHEFINLTKNAYGSDAIKQLAKYY